MYNETNSMTSLYRMTISEYVPEKELQYIGHRDSLEMHSDGLAHGGAERTVGTADVPKQHVLHQHVNSTAISGHLLPTLT